jgi:hypothetical protein
LDSLDTIIIDVAPQIRQILRSDDQTTRHKPEQMSLDKLWSNRRVTRKQVRDEQEGKKRYFDDKVDVEAVLKTWLELPCIQSNEDMDDILVGN